MVALDSGQDCGEEGNHFLHADFTVSVALLLDAFALLEKTCQKDYTVIHADYSVLFCLGENVTGIHVTPSIRIVVRIKLRILQHM